MLLIILFCLQRFVNPSNSNRIQALILSYQVFLARFLSSRGIGNRHLLFDSTKDEDILSQALSDFGTSNKDIYLLYAAFYASGSVVNTNIVRFFILKSNAVALLEETGSTLTTAINADEAQYNETDIERSAGEEKEAPGDLIYSLPDTIDESEYTDLLVGLQTVALYDDVKYRGWSSSKRRRAVEKDVLELVANLGFPAVPTGGRSLLQSDVSTDGTINSGIYYPDRSFRRGYAKKAARVAPLDVDDITVSLVVFARLPTAQDFALVTFYTARLQKKRCFLCDRRDVHSSETDSDKHSKSTKLSEESSSQQNFRDSARFICPRTDEFRFRAYDYAISLSQQSFTMACKECGWFVETCPNHQRQKAKYEEQEHVKWTFTGTKEVEASKTLGGKKVVDPYDVPNKKVYYEKNGAHAPKDEFKKKVVKIYGARIIIPLLD